MKRSVARGMDETADAGADAWLLLAAAALTVSSDTANHEAVRCPSGGCADDPAKISLTGIYLGQAVVAVLAVMAVVSGEYGAGMIRVTLAATPRRLTVLAAKASSSPAWSWSPGRSPFSPPAAAGGLAIPATSVCPYPRLPRHLRQ